MPLQDVYNRTFSRTDVAQAPLLKGTYEACVFDQIDFSNADFSGFLLINCEFNYCNLSLAKLHKTSFQQVCFNECKMMGLRFDSCLPLGLSVSFKHCQLHHSSFYKLSLKKTSFINCQLSDVDFSESNFSESIFSACQLNGAIFDRAVLEKADFRTSYGYAIDPETTRIRGAVFSRSDIEGLLYKYDVRLED